MKDLTIGLSGEQNITVTVHTDFRDQYKALKDVEVDVEIKKHRERRSRNANAYCWEIIGKIADAIRPPIPKDEVYMEMLKRYGQGGVVSIEDRYVARFKREFKYCEELGDAVLNGKTFTHFRFWVGSSQYDTHEMSILIDGIVSEAKELGIDTDTPDQIDRYKMEWGHMG
ncbi:MAG: hypothetical protein RSD95_12555 [Clostridia bacterium]